MSATAARPAGPVRDPDCPECGESVTDSCREMGDSIVDGGAEHHKWCLYEATGTELAICSGCWEPLVADDAVARRGKEYHPACAGAR